MGNSAQCAEFSKRGGNGGKHAVRFLRHKALISIDPLQREGWVVANNNRRIRSPYKEPWMERRLEGDLGFLYGLRNKIVHSGVRVLPRQMVMYLVQLSAEMIFAVMSRNTAY